MTLLELGVRGLGTVDAAVLEPGHGLTVVTGESGAGKSMLMLGLALLGGARADPALLRAGASRILVEARFQVGVPGAALARALDAGAELDDGELLLSRSIAPGGRSRCQVGGCSLPLALLAEVTGELVQSTSQSAHIRLSKPAEQRDVLDRYAGTEAGKVLEQYATAHASWRAVRAELSALQGRSRASAFEADQLRGRLAEIEAVSPQPGEDAELAREADRLGALAGLVTAAGGALAAIAGDEQGGGDGNALSAVAAARAALSGGPSGLDEVLDEAAERLYGLSAELGDIASTLSAYLEDLAADDGRQAEVAERRAALHRLTRAHGRDVDGVLAWAAEAAHRLAVQDGAEGRLIELVEQERTSSREAVRLATRLTSMRRAAAAKLAKEVNRTLLDLAMPHARVVIEVVPLIAAGGDGRGTCADDQALAALTAHGADEVRLLLRPEPGGPAQPLARAASGGELSRVMLALEVALSIADDSSTLIFDEIDAGVGGWTAAEVGRLLARLATTRQVVCVTHLPQVAAHAEQHVLVHRDRGAPAAATLVTALDDTARVAELSRMLAGVEDSTLARGHARELLDSAAHARS